MAPGIVALTPEEALKVLETTRERGAYKVYFKNFWESDAPGVNASEVFPGKKAATLYQGMNLARKDLELDDEVRVIKNEDVVYLIKVS